MTLGHTWKQVSIWTQTGALNPTHFSTKLDSLAGCENVSLTKQGWKSNGWWHLGCFQFGPLQWKLAWTYNGHALAFLLGKYLEVERLDHMVGVCLHFKELPSHLPEQLYLFPSPPAACEGSRTATASPTLDGVSLSDFSHTYAEVVAPAFVLTCIFWRTKDAEHLVMVLSSADLLWFSVCSNFLPAF